MKKKRKIFILLFVFLLSSYNIFAQAKPNPLQEALLLSYDKLKFYLDNTDSYHIQIIYSRIEKNSNNNIVVNTYNYNVNSNNYFYPASTVKLPVILLALEKANNINKEKEENVIDIHSPMATLPSSYCNEAAYLRPNDTNPPCIALYAEKMLLVSDNPSFARLYEFLGQKYIQKELQSKKLDSIRIVRRLASNCYTPEQNACTNAVQFYNKNMQLVFKQDEICNDTIPSPIFSQIPIGKGYIDRFGKYVANPLDFSKDNFMSLSQLHQILISAMLPSSNKALFALTQKDYQFLWRYMGAYPREGSLSNYTPQNGYFDAYKKYLLYGQNPNAAILPNVRIFNIVGLAYGFTTDSAYIVDFENNIAFFLSATIYTNKNGILNDNSYEYASEAMPFMKILGESIYKYELAKSKKYNNNLKKYNLFKN
ncbi:MAG: serine hydrolase [Thermonemataceae bacterium]|nr:serine hydrolase [Thermonemataceae bacterium]